MYYLSLAPRTVQPSCQLPISPRPRRRAITCSWNGGLGGTDKSGRPNEKIPFVSNCKNLFWHESRNRIGPVACLFGHHISMPYAGGEDDEITSFYENSDPTVLFVAHIEITFAVFEKANHIVRHFMFLKPWGDLIFILGNFIENRDYFCVVIGKTRAIHG